LDDSLVNKRKRKQQSPQHGRARAMTTLKDYVDRKLLEIF
jgi:hypothetical protein